MSTHHGFIKEFPFIRVDAFNGEARNVNPYSDDAPLFHLLTHSHTDHFVGLDSPSFSGVIYCTAVTKQLVLQTMEAAERVRHTELKTSKRKFANLWAVERRGGAREGREMMKVLQYNVRTAVQGLNGETIHITALDANHCPGSAMFLIEGHSEGRDKAIIVTGDIRAEAWWVEALRKNPLVQKYLVPSGVGDAREAIEEGKPTWPKLDCIYLDNTYASVDEMYVPKEEAVRELVRIVRMYPPDAKFFLNSWTWGYEDMLKGIATAFNCKIHFDWYKQKLYSLPEVRASDPLLSEVGTMSRNPQRFHACERRWKCDEVWCDGRGCYEWAPEYLSSLQGEQKEFKVPNKGGREEEDAKVVYVNPVAMSRVRWEHYRDSLEERLGKAQGMKMGEGEGDGFPPYLIIPLARHSPLPELQAFVSLFRPQTLYPLTIDDNSPTPCSAYLDLHTQFSKCLSLESQQQLKMEAQKYHRAARGGPPPPAMVNVEEDACFVVGEQERLTTCVLNVEGGQEIEDLVQLWAVQTEIVPPVSPPRKPIRNLKAEIIARRASEASALASESCSAIVNTYTTYYPQSAATLASVVSLKSQPPPIPLPALPSGLPSSLVYPSSSLPKPLSDASHRPLRSVLLPSPSLRGSIQSPRKRDFGTHISDSDLNTRSSSHLRARKTVVFASPTRSPPRSLSRGIHSSPELRVPSQDSSLATLSSTSASSSFPASLPSPTFSTPFSKTRTITARPSRENREVRHKLAALLRQQLGGLLARDGTIVPDRPLR